MPPSTATNVRPPGWDLTPHTRYSVTPARALMPRPGSTTQTRPREPFGRARRASKLVVDDGRQRGDIERRVAADIRNRVAAADVEFGQHQAVFGMRMSAIAPIKRWTASP